MAIPLTNLNNCDAEPIHIPGRIQSHGFLLVVEKNCIIRFISTNGNRFIGEQYAQLLDKPLLQFEQLLQSGTPGFLTSVLMQPAAGPLPFQHPNLLKIKCNEQYFNLIISASGAYTLLEFEPIAVFPGTDVQKIINRSIPGILGAVNLKEVLDFAAVQVRSIIQFDRVMIYQFAADGHGEVVAEAKNDDLMPWLGLHYPASDIPRQARELYKLNTTRLIADVYSADAAIVTTDPEKVLDLTFSQLRAVSPIHIQYLKNMGVASSYSISLLYKNELWGLIACHNYTPRFIDYEVRESSKLVGQILSAALEFRQHSENQQTHALFLHNVSLLAKYLHSKNNIEDALTRQAINLLHIVNATGVVLFYEKKQVGLGKIPDEAALTALVQWINEHHQEAIFYTSALPAEYIVAETYQQLAAGIMVIPLSKELGEYIIWFREEIIQQVKWAGNPAKSAELSSEGILNISPRQSFDAWTTSVTGQSTPWTSEEINAVLRLKEEVLTAISTRASATKVLNEQLRAAYEELDTFSYTVSHDLKTPLTAIKGYAQVLAFDKTTTEQGKLVLQRIVNRADKMNFMIKSVLDYSRIGRLPVDLHLIDTANIVKEIIQDMEHAYPVSGINITVGDMPALRGDPVMIWQVFSNLIGNAVKYSQHAEAPVVHIEGWTSEKQIFYTVKDNGIGIGQKDLDNVFLLFSRMSNVGSIEGAGVGLAIVKKIVEKHAGIIWAESGHAGGTTFFLSFTVA